MTRLITAPLVGGLVGGIEGGIVYAILALIEGQPGWPGLGLRIEVIAIFGMISGCFVGGLIGLVVALRDTSGRGGLIIGTLAGIALSIRVWHGAGPHDEIMRMLAVIVFPAAQSMGLLSAILTKRRKELEPPSDSHTSRRIIT